MFQLLAYQIILLETVNKLRRNCFSEILNFLYYVINILIYPEICILIIPSIIRQEFTGFVALIPLILNLVL